MINRNATAELESEFGGELRRIRLRRNLTQEQLSEQAGIALNAVKNLESGKGATLTSLVRVLRTLERSDWLRSLAPAVSVSPLQALKSRVPRQRASGRRGR